MGFSAWQFDYHNSPDCTQGAIHCGEITQPAHPSIPRRFVGGSVRFNCRPVLRHCVLDPLPHTWHRPGEKRATPTPLVG